MFKFLDAILNYRKIWFGLIFLGSILNAVAHKIEFFTNVSNTSIWCIFLGLIIGVIAHMRGKWL